MGMKVFKAKAQKVVHYQVVVTAETKKEAEELIREGKIISEKIIETPAGFSLGKEGRNAIEEV